MATARSRISLEWILHSRDRAFSDLAQALRGSLRGSYQIMRSYSRSHHVDRILQQVLQQQALDIASQYQDQQRWVGAAQNLRAPYWDWATNSVPPPEVISLQSVDITTPDGNTTTVPNPLYQYTFNPIDPSFLAPYQYWQTTIRHPDNHNSPDASTDAQALQKYDFTLSDPSLSHPFFPIKAICRRFRMISPQVPTIF